MYAVIKTGGERIHGEKGDSVPFDQVLMVEKEGDVRIGRPIVEGAKVVGEILAQTQGDKITVFKTKKRKGYRKKTGHRQPLTSLKIREISL